MISERDWQEVDADCADDHAAVATVEAKDRVAAWADVRLACGSVPGLGHIASCRSCEDASAAVRFEDGLVLAVADGHGSIVDGHPDEGARAAVDAAVTILPSLLPTLTSRRPNEVWMQRVVRKLVLGWQERVRSHAAARAVGPRHQRAGWAEDLQPYGTTLVAAALTEKRGLFLRIGDGDALLVDSEGARCALPRSRGETATLSLASRHCVTGAEVQVLDLTNLSLRLVALTTDGASDMYLDDVYPSWWGTQLCRYLDTHPWGNGVEHLFDRLKQATFVDADDASVALAYWPSCEGGVAEEELPQEGE